MNPKQYVTRRNEIVARFRDLLKGKPLEERDAIYEARHEELEALRRDLPVPHVHIRTSAYTVSCFPPDHEEGYAWEITIEYRGHDRWAVTHGGSCLNSDNGWDHEPSGSERTDAYLATHRFILSDAIIRARDAAPKVIVNGWTPAEVLTAEEYRREVNERAGK